jgi:hypothetical protein
MFVRINVVYLRDGHLRRRTISTPLRHLDNARPWLTNHFPNTRFIWKACVAFYR